jgi:hypothetical protein
VQKHILKAIQQAGDKIGIQPGDVIDVTVRHDDWCGIFTNGVCNCEPTVEARHVQ